MELGSKKIGMAAKTETRKGKRYFFLTTNIFWSGLEFVIRSVYVSSLMSTTRTFSTTYSAE